MPGIAYLGPEGTFTEVALRAIEAQGLIPPAETLDTAPLTPIPTESTVAALSAVRAGEADYAVVPIENSIDGSVSPTLDSLAADAPLQIFAELTLEVCFTIAVRPATAASDVQTVAAFPVAAAQVKHWLAAHLPKTELVPANSNAAAAKDVAAGQADAAVTTALAAQRYGLQ
ncbi:MAG: prephenate dehydratase, partial [Mycobacterium sp.]|nr:prephenate dehydratase [Mycobacterium sp.]